jgi:hypothetical protein
MAYVPGEYDASSSTNTPQQGRQTGKGGTATNLQTLPRSDREVPTMRDALTKDPGKEEVNNPNEREDERLAIEKRKDEEEVKTTNEEEGEDEMRKEQEEEEVDISNEEKEEDEVQKEEEEEEDEERDEGEKEEREEHKDKRHKEE